MRKLFPEPEHPKSSLSDFERQVLTEGVNWQIFYSLKEAERERAVGILLEQKVLSIEKEGHFSVVLADSCRQDLAFDYKGTRVYFSDKKYADSFRNYLELQGCINIAKKR